MDTIRFFGLDFSLTNGRYQFKGSTPASISKVLSLDIRPSKTSISHIRVNKLHFVTAQGVEVYFACPAEIRFSPQLKRGRWIRVYAPQWTRSRYAAQFALRSSADSSIPKNPTYSKPSGTFNPALATQLTGKFGTTKQLASVFRSSKRSTRTLGKLIKDPRFTSKGLLSVDIGGLKFSEINTNVVIARGADGLYDFWVQTQKSHNLVDVAKAPLAVRCNANSRFRIYYGGWRTGLQLQGQRNPFTLTTQFGDSDSSSKRWQNTAFEANLGQLKRLLTLTFKEDSADAGPMLLHPFSRTQQGTEFTLAALDLDVQSITIVAKRNLRSLRRMRITDISAKPHVNARLRTYGMVANNDQGFHQWQVRGNIPLAVRLAGHGGLPKGLLLRSNSEHIALTQSGADLEILGLRRELKLSCKPNGILKFSQDQQDFNSSVQFDRSLVRVVTTPFIEAPFVALQLNRPGIALTQKGAQVSSWNFTPSGANVQPLAIPICPDEAMQGDNGFALSRLHAHCNRLPELVSVNESVKHESHLIITGNRRDHLPADRPRLHTLFGPITDDIAEHASDGEIAATMAAPKLGEHLNRFSFGRYLITHTWGVGEVPEYIPIIADSQGNVFIDALDLVGSFPLDPAYSEGEQNIAIRHLSSHNGLAIEGSDRGRGKHLVGLVKLGKEQDLFGILRQENVVNDAIEEPQTGLRALLPQKLQTRAWTGLILFEQALDLSSFPLLQSLLPADFELNLRYLAVSPEVENNRFSTYGKVFWKNPKLDLIRQRPQGDASSELNVQMAKVEITWAARKLTHFLAEARVNYLSFAGARKPQRNNQPQYTRVDILGSIDQETQEIRFLAQSNKPIPLLAEDGEGVGPIKQVFVKQIEITHKQGKTDFNVDGNLELNNFSLGQLWDFDKGDKLNFDGLKFGFLNNLELDGNWLSFDYPSLKFDFSKGWKLLDFDGFRLDLIRLGFDTSDSNFDWKGLLPIIDGEWHRPAMRFGFRLNLGKLPLLSDSALQDMVFDFELSLPFLRRGNSIDYLTIDFENCRLAVQALGFDKLNIKLMRFLEISAENLQLAHRPAPNNMGDILWLFLQGLRLKILNKTIIDDFTFGHYWAGEQTGFVGLLNDDIPAFSFVTIDWLLIGRNLLLNGGNNHTLIESVVSIDPDTPPLKNQLRAAFEGGQLVPLAEDNNTIGEWVFAAGFNILDGFLIGKFLFQDNAYYGLAIEGRFLRHWFGYDLAISVLYIVQDRPEEDLFKIALQVPSVSLGGLAFNGGIIAVEIQMNGGFMVDIGFPWQGPDGERLWERGFGMMLSGIMGRGGCFIAQRTSVRTGNAPDEEGARLGKLTLVEGGYAAAVGIGGEYNSGSLRVSAYAGIYYSCEGGMLFISPQARPSDLELVGLRLSGAIGIQARGIAELDWWIISIRVEVIAGAEARLTVFWGALEHHQPGSANLPAVMADVDPRIGVSVDFVLYARVSARACIGKGWFKVCKSIEVGVSMDYRTTLYLS